MLEPFVKMGNKSIRRNLLDQLRSLNKEQGARRSAATLLRDSDLAVA